MKKVVIFGAGQIGRGFLGEICAAEGYSLVFVDVVPELVHRLNQEKSYPLWILGEKKEEKEITNLRAILLSEKESVVQELLEVSLVFTAVGADNLTLLGPVLAEGISKKARRQPDSFLNIVICENLLDAGQFLNQIIQKNLPAFAHNYLKNNVGLVETVVSRMVAPLTEEKKKIHPLLVTVEPYNILPVSRPSFKGEIPSLKSFYLVEKILPYEELKLFGHNLTHAAAAYLGWRKNLTFIWEAMEDEQIRSTVSRVRKEAGQALAEEHHFPGEEMENYFTDLFHRFQNRLLGDTVVRVGRDPLRKLGPGERIVGAIKLCLKHGIFPEAICLVAAACLCYNEKSDSQAVKLQSQLHDQGIEYVLSQHCQLPSGPVRERIKIAYEVYKNESRNSERY